MRMRPAPSISRSNAVTRSASPARDSIGGFAFTTTLRRTRGNLERPPASVASASPVSAATPGRARAEPPEDARRHAIGRAVGAVEHDGEPAEVEREGPAEEVDVVRLRARVGDEAADPGAARPGRAVLALEALLDLVLPGVGELRP